MTVFRRGGTSGFLQHDAGFAPQVAARFRVPAVLSLGALICVAVTTAVSAATVAVRADGSPILPPGRWQPALAISLVVAFSAYVVALYALGRVELDRRLAVAVTVAVQVFPLLGPVLLSTDVRMYVAYARLAQAGANPYIESPTNQLPSVYGPLFTLWSEGIDLIVTSLDAAVTVHRLFAAGAIILIAWIASRRVRNPALTVALVGWNPLVALHFGGGGHNDALMTLLALLAITLADRARWFAAGAVWACSGAVKLLTVGLFPIAAVAVIRQGGRLAFIRLLAGAGAAAVAIGTVASARYGTAWWNAVATLSDVGGRTGSIGLSRLLNAGGLSEDARRSAVASLQFMTIAALSLHAGVTGRARLGLAAALLACFQGWLNPWYALWGLALSAADDRERAGRIISVGLSGYLLIDVTSW